MNHTCIRIVWNNIHFIIWSCVSNVNSLFQLVSFSDNECFFMNFLSWIFFFNFTYQIFQYLLILFQLIVWVWPLLILTLISLDRFEMLAHYIMSLSEFGCGIQILNIQCIDTNLLSLSRLSRLYMSSCQPRLRWLRHHSCLFSRTFLLIWREISNKMTSGTLRRRFTDGSH